MKIQIRKVKIKIIGIGGAGGNILTRMYKKKADGVDFVAVNTDSQGLHFTKADEKIRQIIQTLDKSPETNAAHPVP